MASDSVWVAAFRSCLKAVGVVIGLFIGVFVVVAVMGIVRGPDYFPPRSDVKIMADAQGSRVMLPESAPVVACLNFSGVVGMKDMTSEKIRNVLLDLQEEMFKGGRVKAVLLNINTPGGSAIDSDTIYRMIMSYKQKYHVPVYAHVDGLCASGGMYIACAADKIYATNSSIIGSVGVVMGPNFNFSDAMIKYGIGALTLTEGKDKDELNPFRAWKPNEGATLKVAMKGLYDQFVAVVSASRPKLTKDRLVNDVGAHIFIAQEAQALGYIDVAGASYTQALGELVQAAGLGDTAYQVFQVTPARPFFSDFAETLFPGGVFNTLLGIPSAELHQLKGQPLYYHPM